MQGLRTSILHPERRLVGVLDDEGGEVRLASKLAHARHVVEELVFGIRAEVDNIELGLAHVRSEGHEILDAEVGEAEGATGERGVATAEREGGQPPGRRRAHPARGRSAPRHLRRCPHPRPPRQLHRVPEQLSHAAPITVRRAKPECNGSVPGATRLLGRPRAR